MMFVFQADTYCDSCGERIRADLTAEGSAPADPADEYSYDSDDFPKGPFAEEPTDCPDHCASGGDCLEGIDLGEYGLPMFPISAPLYGAETRKVGAVLSEDLTEHGAEYLREMLAEEPRTPYQSALHALWRETFGEHVEEEETPDEDDGFLTSAGPLGGLTVASFGGKVLGTFVEETDARAAIRAAAEEECYWPNVWQVSDHGNAHLCEDFYGEEPS